MENTKILSSLSCDQFFERKERGDYSIVEKPRQISNRELYYEAMNEIPEIIDENKSVKWNRVERERLIKEATIKKTKEQSAKNQEWHKKEAFQISKYSIELENMLKYELEMNEEQLWLFLKKSGFSHYLIWDGCGSSFSKEDFEEIKEEKDSLFSFFEKFQNAKNNH